MNELDYGLQMSDGSYKLTNEGITPPLFNYPRITKTSGNNSVSITNPLYPNSQHASDIKPPLTQHQNNII